MSDFFATLGVIALTVGVLILGIYLANKVYELVKFVGWAKFEVEWLRGIQERQENDILDLDRRQAELGKPKDFSNDIAALHAIVNTVREQAAEALVVSNTDIFKRINALDTKISVAPAATLEHRFSNFQGRIDSLFVIVRDADAQWQKLQAELDRKLATTPSPLSKVRSDIDLLFEKVNRLEGNLDLVKANLYTITEGFAGEGGHVPSFDNLVVQVNSLDSDVKKLQVELKEEATGRTLSDAAIMHRIDKTIAKAPIVLPPIPTPQVKEVEEQVWVRKRPPLDPSFHGDIITNEIEAAEAHKLEEYP